MTPAQYDIDCVEQQKRAFIEQERCSTQNISGSSDMPVIIAVLEELFKTYLTE